MKRVYIIGGVALAVLITYQGRKVMEPKGIRNNNPGNIRITNIKWQGKVPVDKNTDGEFEQFYKVEDGLRALARNLRTYYNNGIVTVADIIERWAPPNGKNKDGSEYRQNTNAYTMFVASKAGLNPYDPINPEVNLEPIIFAIIQHENGKQPYTQGQIQQAISDAGWQFNQWG